jgi:hypothetical protein
MEKLKFSTTAVHDWANKLHKPDFELMKALNEDYSYKYTGSMSQEMLMQYSLVSRIFKPNTLNQYIYSIKSFISFVEENQHKYKTPEECLKVYLFNKGETQKSGIRQISKAVRYYFQIQKLTMKK